MYTLYSEFYKKHSVSVNIASWSLFEEKLTYGCTNRISIKVGTVALSKNAIKTKKL